MNHNYLRRHFSQYTKTGSILEDHSDRPNLKTISWLLAHDNYDLAILSAEEFENTDPAATADVINRFIRPNVDEIKIICYVRPHAARILSEYAEQTKIGIFDGTLAEFHKKLLENRRLIFEERLARWKREFKQEFVARPAVTRVLANESVLDDFVEQAIGTTERANVGIGTRTNESLSLNDLMKLKLLHRILKPQKPFVLHAMGWLLAEQLSSGSQTDKTCEKLTLHQSLADQIMLGYKEDAIAIDKRFFKEHPVFWDELRLATSLAREQPQSLEPEDHLNESEKHTVEAFAAVMKLMLAKKGSGPWAGYLQEHRVRTFWR